MMMEIGSGQQQLQVYSLNTPAWHIVRTPAPIFEFHDILWFHRHSPGGVLPIRALNDTLLVANRLNNFSIINQDLCVLRGEESDN